MPTKTNTKTTANARKQVYAKNRPFISRVTFDGILLAGLGLVMAIAAIVCFQGFYTFQEMSPNDFSVDTVKDEEADSIMANASEVEKLLYREIKDTRDSVSITTSYRNVAEMGNLLFLLTIIFGSLSLTIFIADFVYINHSSIRLAQKM